MSNARRQKYSYVDEWKSLWEPDLEAIAYNGITVDPTKVDPKVLQWAKNNCALKPHFVKVINPTAAHGRPGLRSRNSTYLYVPTPFVQEHFKELERVVTLENDDGRTWRVSFGSRPRKDARWVQGWARVAKENNINPGDVIVVVLVRNSRFRFTLFDGEGNLSTEKSTSTLNDGKVTKEPSCSSHSHQDEPSISNPDQGHPKTRRRLFESDDPCRKKVAQLSTPAINEQVAKPSCKEEKLHNVGENIEAVCRSEKLATKNERNTSRGESHSTKTVKTMSTKEEKSCEAGSGNSHQPSPAPTVLHGTNPPFESVDPFAFSIKSRRRVTTPRARQRAWDAAMDHAKFRSGLHFISVMSETQVYRDFHMVLPDCFVAESSFPTVAARWRLLDCDGNSWEMYSMKNKHNEVALHRKHWALFSLHHFLEEGDVCVFELKEDEALAIVVHIFRVVAISMVDKNSVHAHYEMREIA